MHFLSSQNLVFFLYNYKCLQQKLFVQSHLTNELNLLLFVRHRHHHRRNSGRRPAGLYHGHRHCRGLRLHDALCLGHEPENVRVRKVYHCGLHALWLASDYHHLPMCAVNTTARFPIFLIPYFKQGRRTNFCGAVLFSTKQPRRPLVLSICNLQSLPRLITPSKMHKAFFQFL